MICVCVCVCVPVFWCGYVPVCCVHTCRVCHKRVLCVYVVVWMCIGEGGKVSIVPACLHMSICAEHNLLTHILLGEGGVCGGNSLR